jgi:hypothetical protein
MAVESSPDLIEAIFRKLSELLEKPVARDRPDLLAKSFALLTQPSLPGRDPDWKGNMRSTLEEMGTIVTVGLDRFARSF